MEATEVTVKLDPAQAIELMPRCGTCRHWEHVYGKDVCSALVNDLNDRGYADGPWYWHGTLHDGQLCTRADFGCVLWEGKGEATS